MDKYIKNENTLALLTIDNKVKIVEKYIDFYIEGSLNNIINDSCIYYGSTFLGRMHSAKSLLGISTKLPIIISEKKELIFFPTNSYKNTNCVWINYIEVDKYYSINSKELIITFLNKKKLVIPVSNNIFTKQLFKASRLDTIFKRNIK